MFHYYFYFVNSVRSLSYCFFNLRMLAVFYGVLGERMGFFVVGDRVGDKIDWGYLFYVCEGSILEQWFCLNFIHPYWSPVLKLILQTPKIFSIILFRFISFKIAAYFIFSSAIFNVLFSIRERAWIPLVLACFIFALFCNFIKQLRTWWLNKQLSILGSIYLFFFVSCYNLLGISEIFNFAYSGLET